jgi:peptidoglycan/xylan/chitin deacetylase (PgdA/CDA1 family)
MSFTGLKHISYKEAILSIHMGLSNTEKKVYLTFDDGPTPKVTEWVLKTRSAQRQSYFFALKKYRSIPIYFEKLIEKKHSVGNHTFDHLNGWKTTNNDYNANISLCENRLKIILWNRSLDSKIFRPPYGKIKSIQAKKITASRVQDYYVGCSKC